MSPSSPVIRPGEGKVTMSRCASPGRRGPLVDAPAAFEAIFPAPAVEAKTLSPPVLAAAEDDRAGIPQPDIPERLDDHLREGGEAAGAFRRAVMRRDEPYDLAPAAG